MQFVAHRGVVNSNIKENSLEAFKEAISNNNYIGFELDLRVSKDGIFVINHDFIHNNKLIKNTNYSSLYYDGLCRLKDVLRLNTNKLIMIEIKDFDIDLNKLHNMIKNYSNIYVMSFNHDVIYKLSKYKRKYKVGILNYIFNSNINYKYIDFICLLYMSITENIVNYFYEKSIDIFAYGIPYYLNIKDYKINYIVDDNYLKRIQI